MAEQRVLSLLRLDAKANLEAVHADPGLLLKERGHCSSTSGRRYRRSGTSCGVLSTMIRPVGSFCLPAAHRPATGALPIPVPGVSADCVCDR